MTFASDQNLIKTAADDALNRAQTFLDNLVSASSINFGGLPFSVDTILPNSYAANFSVEPQLPDAVATFPSNTNNRPNIGALDLLAPPIENPGTFSFSTLQPMSFPVDDLLAPTAQFKFVEGVYDTALLDPLKAKLINDLQNGGYGIDTSDEEMLFNRARDREVEAMMSRISDAGRSMAARGFPLPPGELAIHIDQAYQEMQNKVSDVSRDITLQRNKLFVENRQFTIREVRELQQLVSNHFNAVQERAFNVAKITAEFGITVYNAQLALFKTRFETTKLKADAQHQISQVEVDRARAYLEEFRAQISLYETNLRKLLEPARLKVDLYRADIESDRVKIDNAVQSADIQYKAFDAVVRKNIEVLHLAVDDAKVKLEAAIAAVKLRVASAEYGSDKWFAVLAALSGAANVLSVQTATA